MQRKIVKMFGRVIFWGLFLAAPVQGKEPDHIEEKIACPPFLVVATEENIQKIYEEKPLVTDAAETWFKTPDPDRRDLVGAGVFDGHPDEMERLKDDEVKIIRGHKAAIITLTQEPAHPRRYWLKCHYYQTGVALMKPIPQEAKACAWYQAKRVGETRRQPGERFDQVIFCY